MAKQVGLKIISLIQTYWLSIVIGIFTVGGAIAGAKIYREWDIERIAEVEKQNTKTAQELKDHYALDTARASEAAATKTKVDELQSRCKPMEELLRDNCIRLASISMKVDMLDRKIDELSSLVKQHVLSKSASSVVVCDENQR